MLQLLTISLELHFVGPSGIGRVSTLYLVPSVRTAHDEYQFQTNLRGHRNVAVSKKIIKRRSKEHEFSRGGEEE